jgi:hypothetical protein
VTGPRLTVRVRLTLIYTGLFAACGAIVVAVSYALVAHNLVAGREEFSFAQSADPAAFQAQCERARATHDPDVNLLDKCDTFFQHRPPRASATPHCRTCCSTH